MASQTTNIRGNNWMIFLSTGSTATAKPFAYATNAKLSSNGKTYDRSSKDSGNWDEILPGKKNWSFTTDTFMNYGTTGATLTTSTLIKYYLNDTLLYMTAGQSTGSSPSWTATGEKYKGRGYITATDLGAGNDENATVTYTFTGDGELTQATS